MDKRLDGYLIKPMNFDPDQSYPLLLDVYGGPGSQGVYNTFETSGWHQYLAKESWVDRERIGIMGHSFGGFSAGMSLLLHPDVFKAGIVTAAISDHRNYDCILTEQYMGLL